MDGEGRICPARTMVGPAVEQSFTDTTETMKRMTGKFAREIGTEQQPGKGRGGR